MHCACPHALALASGGFCLFRKRKSRSKKAQPKLEKETIVLIQEMAKENSLWGADRIQGKFLKLGIQLAKRTLQKYVRPSIIIVTTDFE